MVMVVVVVVVIPLNQSSIYYFFLCGKGIIMKEKLKLFISNFRHVFNVVFFPLGDSPNSEFYSVSSFFIGGVSRENNSSELFFLLTPPMAMELTGCSETSAHKTQTPENHPKERIQQ